MKRIRDVLNPADYRNYILIRAVSILFVITGAIYAVAGITVFIGIPPIARPLPFGIGLFIFVLGLSAFVGGIALFNGTRRSSTLRLCC